MTARQCLFTRSTTVPERYSTFFNEAVTVRHPQIFAAAAVASALLEGSRGGPTRLKQAHLSSLSQPGQADDIYIIFKCDWCELVCVCVF